MIDAFLVEAQCERAGHKHFQCHITGKEQLSWPGITLRQCDMLFIEPNDFSE